MVADRAQPKGRVQQISCTLGDWPQATAGVSHQQGQAGPDWATSRACSIAVSLWEASATGSADVAGLHDLILMLHKWLGAKLCVMSTTVVLQCLSSYLHSCPDPPVLQVNDCKHRISELKALIQQRRVQQSMASLTGDAADQAPDAEEDRAKSQI